MSHAEIRYPLALLLRRNRSETCISPLILIACFVSCVFSRSKAILLCLSKAISSMFITSSNDGCGRVMPQVLTSGNAECSSSNDTPCAYLLVPKFIVWIFSVSRFLAVNLDMVQVEVAWSTRSLVVRALVLNLDVPRSLANFETISVVSRAGSSRFLGLRGKSFSLLIWAERALCVTMRPLKTHPTKKGSICID